MLSPDPPVLLKLSKFENLKALEFNFEKTTPMRLQAGRA